MNKKLFSTLFIIAILASFSAIGCKNNNTNPDTTQSTDIGEKYAGTWYLNATPNLKFYPEVPVDYLANIIIVLFNDRFNNPAVNQEYTINSDGSIVIGTGITQEKIEKNKISKEGNNKYIIDFPIDGFDQSIYFTITAMRQAYTFNADGKTATAESYVTIDVQGKSYNVYIYQDGTFTTTKK